MPSLLKFDIILLGDKMNIKQYLNKKNIIILVTIILVLFVLASIFIYKHNNNSNNGLKYNENSTFTKAQKVNGIVFENIKCTYDGENSDISYTMINKTKNTIYLSNYDIL